MIEELPPGSRQAAKALTMPVPAPAFVLDGSILDGGDVLKGAWVSEEFFRSILFPTTAAASITPSQRRDILHLQLHVWHGADCFVTLNPNDFIRAGKQEALRSLGIWVFTPVQMVAHLRAGYGDPAIIEEEGRR